MEIVEDLLIGEYKIIQDSELYRFTSDSVLLARFLKAKKGERVADFCAGSGVVGLHFYAENTGVQSVTLFEMQKELSEMSEKTVALNNLANVFRVENLRLQDIGGEYTEKFSLILCNPPYERGGFENADEKKALCRKELFLTLEELILAAKKCLKFGGRFALVHRADRVAEVITALSNVGLEPKKMQFIAGKAGEKPYAVLVAAVKGGKKGVEVLPTHVNI
ncbi:MAG: methyltransferase [Clostridiales bacterium]|nr:methyltransferase [Clostridiales bacterium]